MTEIKKNQIYHLIGPMNHEAYALVLERTGNQAKIMLLSDDIHIVKIEQNEMFGSEYCKVPGEYCDFLLSSACAMKKNDDRELYEMITRVSAKKVDRPNFIARHLKEVPTTSPCRGTSRDTTKNPSTGTVDTGSPATGNNRHADGPSSSDMGGTSARAICRRLALRLPFRLRQVARAFSFGR